MNADILERPPAALARLRWRGLRGAADYPALAKLGQHCNLADHVGDVLTVEGLANDLEHLPNFDPEHDVQIAELEGRPVAWGWTNWRLEGSQYYYWVRGFVAPGWRRRGIGRALLRRGEGRLAKVAAGHTAKVGQLYSAFSPAKRVGKVALLEAEGYRAVRHFYTMLRGKLDDLPAAPLPAGFELRAARPEDWRAIWDANEEAFQDHWGHITLTEADFEHMLTQADFDPSLWQVAWHTASNQVAGMAINLIPASANAAHGWRRGVVDNLSVRRPWRKQGLGRALLVASLRALRARGQDEAMLGVDAENTSGALRLYEATGFRQSEHGMAFQKAVEA